MEKSDHLVCPILGEIMMDPVIDREGNTYERSAITEWLQKSGTSPITRSPMSIDDLTSNRVLSGILEEYRVEFANENDDVFQSTIVGFPTINFSEIEQKDDFNKSDYESDDDFNKSESESESESDDDFNGSKGQVKDSPSSTEEKLFSILSEFQIGVSTASKKYKFMETRKKIEQEFEGWNKIELSNTASRVLYGYEKACNLQSRLYEVAGDMATLTWQKKYRKSFHIPLLEVVDELDCEITRLQTMQARRTDDRYSRGGNRDSRRGSGGDMVYARLDLSDRRKFISTPIAKDAGVVRCCIRIDSSSTRCMSNPIYSLHLNEGDVFLLTARNRNKINSSNYLISIGEGDFDRHSCNYMGELRSNMLGTEYQIFDDGYQPTGGSAGQNQNVHKSLAAVVYTGSLFCSRGPRKMEVAIPSIDEDGNISSSIRPGEEDFLGKIRDRNFRDLVYMINKPPRWNDQVGAYVLNFNGRVTMASIKNFQLVDPEEQDVVILQCGRIGKNEFTMDLQWPMTPLQAFAISMSSLDSKIE